MAKSSFITSLREVTRPYGRADPRIDQLAEDLSRRSSPAPLIGELHRFHSFRKKTKPVLGVYFEALGDAEIQLVEHAITAQIERMNRVLRPSATTGEDLVKARIDLEALLVLRGDLTGQHFDFDEGHFIESFARTGHRITLPTVYEILLSKVYPSDSAWYAVLWNDEIWQSRVPADELVPSRALYERCREERERRFDEAVEVYLDYEE